MDRRTFMKIIVASPWLECVDLATTAPKTVSMVPGGHPVDIWLDGEPVHHVTKFVGSPVEGRETAGVVTRLNVDNSGRFVLVIDPRTGRQEISRTESYGRVRWRFKPKGEKC